MAAVGDAVAGNDDDADALQRLGREVAAQAVPKAVRDMMAFETGMSMAGAPTDAIMKALNLVTQSPSLRAMQTAAQAEVTKWHLRPENTLVNMPQLATDPWQRRLSALYEFSEPVAQVYRSLVLPISERVTGQMALLANVTSPLEHYAEQATTAWLDSVRPEIPTIVLDGLVPFGYAVEGLNSAAYALADEDDDALVEAVDRAAARQEIRTEQGDRIAAFLGVTDPSAAEQYEGMWWSIRDRRPGWASSAANHGIEVIDRVLHALAPPEELVAWHETLPPDEQAKNDFVIKNGEIVLEKGIPKATRTLRVKYIAAQRGLPANVAKYTTSGLTGALKELQGVKHAGTDAQGASVEAVAVAIEAFLIGLLGQV
jgi:hypothetical protein